MKLNITKEQLYIAIGYAVFMILFYFIGITGARLNEFVAIGLLTGFYYFIVRVIKKIAGKG